MIPAWTRCRPSSSRRDRAVHLSGPPVGETIIPPPVSRVSSTKRMDVDLSLDRATPPLSRTPGQGNGAVPAGHCGHSVCRGYGHVPCSRNHRGSAGHGRRHASTSALAAAMETDTDGFIRSCRGRERADALMTLHRYSAPHRWNVSWSWPPRLFLPCLFDSLSNLSADRASPGRLPGRGGRCQLYEISRINRLG